MRSPFIIPASATIFFLVDADSPDTILIAAYFASVCLSLQSSPSLPTGAITRRWASPTRLTFRRNTASNDLV